MRSDLRAQGPERKGVRSLFQPAGNQASGGLQLTRIDARAAAASGGRSAGLSYRPITEEDLPFLFQVYASTRLEELAVTGWPDEAKRGFLAQQFGAQHDHYQRHYPDAEWLVIDWNGDSAGRLYLEEWPSQIRLIDIAILPEFRGRGIGSAILSDLLEWASAKRKAVSIHVEKNNPARSLYDRLGFRPSEDKGVYDLLEWRPPENGR